MVNRGWIPRYFVHDDRRPREFLVPTWDRPTGPLTVTCISNTPEKPKIVVPEHKMDGAMAELFWMDFKTLKEHISGGSDDVVGDKGSNDPTILAMVTAVQEDDGSDDTISDMPTSYPVAPPAKTVGEFKTTPMIHAGYAATWYGLATAGLVMTRMLILRK
uniref:SURF1-like protein n=1 Tax=Entomoneis paludosa TaxID=265537 RepID=A0A7S2VAB1_9STRA